MVTQTQMTPVINPYNDEVVAQVPDMGEDQVRAAIARAEAAAPIMAAMPAHQRGRILNKTAQLIEDNSEDLARLIDARLAGIGRNVDWETLAVLDEEEYPDEQRLHDRFYRVLREQSRGIPGVALALAADAFGLADDGSVAVHLAELPDGGGVVDMGADVRFVLAALASHGDMLPDEILAATRLPAGVVATLIGRLIDRGVLARGEGTLRITPAWVTAITDSLRRRGYLHGG